MANLQTDGAQVFALWPNKGTTRRPKRPRDPVLLAIAAPTEEHGAGRVTRCRVGGSRSGKARVLKTTPEQRSEIARLAAHARWKKLP